MRTSSLLLLASGRAPADRGRTVGLAVAVGIAGALLLVGARIATMSDDAIGLAQYLTEADLRTGVVVAAALVAVPVLAVAWQMALLGGTDRRRRFTDLRVAGATRGDLRRIAGVQTGRATALGGLLALPGYLLLFVLLGALPPPGARFAPPPVLDDVGRWLAILVLFTALGAVVGWASHRGVSTGSPSAVSAVRVVAIALLLVVAMVLIGLVMTSSISGTAVLGAAFVLVLIVAMLAGPVVAGAIGRRLRRRGNPVDVLAGALVLGDPRGIGRVAGVLWFCGIGFGAAASLAASVLYPATSGVGTGLTSFYLGGVGASAAAVLVGVVAAVVSLTVGAADQLTTARRALASQVALGVEVGVLERALRRRLTSVSAPAIGCGVLVASVVLGPLAGVVAIVAAVIALLLSLTVVHACAAVAVRALRSRLHLATSADQLRVG